MIERHWLASATVVLAIGANALALTSVIHPGRWLTWSILFSAVIAVSMGLARTIIRPVLPALAGLVVSLCTMTALYSAPQAIAGFIPTSASLQTLGALVRQGIEQVRQEQAPTDPTVGLSAIVLGATGMLTVVMILVAVDLAVPALAGTLLLGYWVFPGMLRPPPALVFVIGAAGFLLLLLGTIRSTTGREPWPTRRAPIAVAASLVAASVLAGLALPSLAAQLPWWGQGASTTGARTGAGGGISLNLAIDIRDNLENQSSRVLMTTRSPRALGPLRLYTLTTFDGRTWQPDPDPVLSDLPAVADLQPAWPGEVPALYRDSGSYTAQVQVHDLVESRLPIPLAPRTMDLARGWRYDATHDEVVGRGNTRGMTYRMTVESGNITADDLRAAPVTTPSADYLTVAPSEHRDQIGAQARQLTQDAPTPYDKLIALQEYFRDSGDFTYSLIVPPATSSDAIWDFLRAKQGYCLQFASAMVVMGRTLGIPMRMAVGFLPGTPDGEGGASITGDQAHAWPEAFFEGIGWIRFEPTPAQQSGAVAPWQSATARPTTSAAPGPATESATATSQSAAAVPNSTTTGATLQLLIPLAVLIAAVILTLVLWRRRLVAPADSPAGLAWHEVCAAARRAGVSWPAGTTPRALTRQVATVLSDDPEAVAALQRISDAYELDRFSPTSTDASPTDLRASRDRVVHALKSHHFGAAYPSEPPCDP